MNTIQTTKANSTIRRFFSRMGGGGVKALGYKTINISNEGGGTSSEDAEKMYEALFGQTPYLAVARSEAADEEEGGVVLVPLYEIFAGNDIGGEIVDNEFFFKSSTPVPKATMMKEDNGETYMVFPPPDTNIYMMEIPTEVSKLPDTWYTPVPYDVNLVGYTTPTEGNPTIVSGTLPDKEEIEALMSDHPVSGEDPTEVYTWDTNKNAFVNNISDTNYYYMLRQSDNNVIEWSFNYSIPPSS